MFNVSVRKIVISSIAVAAPLAMSFGASTEAWGGGTTGWNKVSTGNHAGGTTGWNKVSTHAGGTTGWNKAHSVTLAGGTTGWNKATTGWN